MKITKLHQKVLDDALERYKCRSLQELRMFRDVYKGIRSQAIKDKDARWKTPMSEDKMCVKEHIKLIRMAMESKKPVTINCVPAKLGAETNK